jgi:hypothetical protein
MGKTWVQSSTHHHSILQNDNVWNWRYISSHSQPWHSIEVNGKLHVPAVMVPVPIKQAPEKLKIPAITLKWIPINQPAACHYTGSAILDLSRLSAMYCVTE